MYQKVWFTCRVVGCLPFTKSSRKIQSECRWNTILLFASGSNGTSEKRVLGAFHSTKTSGLNFRQLPVANGTAFSKLSQKKTTSRGIPKFGKFFPGSFLSIQLCSRNFWKLFREISVPFHAVSKYSKVLIDWKAPKLPVGMFQTEILVPFLRSLFADISFRFLRPFFGKWNWFVQMVNVIPGRNLPVLNFAYPIYPNRKPTSSSV